MTPALDAFRKKHAGRVPVQREPADDRPKGVLSIRNNVRVPTPGSQRRCYNGCFPDSDWEMVWGRWEVIRHNCTEDAKEFWEDQENTQVKWEQHE